MISADIFKTHPDSGYMIHLNHPEARELWQKWCTQTGNDVKNCAGEARLEWEREVYRQYLAERQIDPELHPCLVAVEMIKKILV